MSFPPNVRYHRHKASQIKDPENFPSSGDPVTPAEHVAPIATPASATAQVVAEKVNDLIQALIDADLMEAS